MDWSIACRLGVLKWVRRIVAQVEMAGIPASGMRENKVSGVGFHPQDHIRCIKSDFGIRIRGGIIKKHVGVFLGRFCWFSLLGRNIVEGWKHGWIDGTGVI